MQPSHTKESSEFSLPQKPTKKRLHTLGIPYYYHTPYSSLLYYKRTNFQLDDKLVLGLLPTGLVFHVEERLR
jgi:hypothetical protein